MQDHPFSLALPACEGPFRDKFQFFVEAETHLSGSRIPLFVSLYTVFTQFLNSLIMVILIREFIPKLKNL